MEVFSSQVTLSFKDKHISSEYYEMTYKLMKSYNWIFTAFVLVFIIFSTSLVYTFKLPVDSDQHLVVEVVSYTGVIIALLSIGFLLRAKFCPTYRFLQKITCLYNCLGFFFCFSFIRYYVLTLTKADVSLFYLMHFFEFSSRGIIIYVGLLEFIEILYVTISLITIFAVYYSPIISWWVNIPYSYITYVIFSTFLVLFAYFNTRERKKSFYYNRLIQKHIKWYENVFDATNSGFLQISSGKIVFANRMMREQVLNFSSSPNVERSGTFCSQKKSTMFLDSLKDNSELLLKELFSDLESPIVDEGEMMEVQGDPTSFLKKIKSIYIRSNEVNFINLGFKTYSITTSNYSTEEIIYDIMYRFYLDDEKESYEFIFNDVTRAREIEKKNAEFKYKVLYLAKVAHEFKNPLICISEIVEKCNEAVNEIKSDRNQSLEVYSNKLVDNLKLISSLSKFLIILTKDLDYFSGSQIEGNCAINITPTNLNTLLEFVNEVAKGLLLKSNKSDNVDFVIKQDKHVPQIIQSDEVKLKQVLINLCSNAIKFTDVGSVTLSIAPEKDKLRFQVDDTGIGMSLERMARLFHPFSSDQNNKNLLGTGLGLNIVMDITSKFGSPVKVSSKLGEGSKFWFSIPLNKEKDTMINVDDITLEQRNDPIESNAPENMNSDPVSSFCPSAKTVKKEFSLFFHRHSNSEMETILELKPCKRVFTIIVADDDIFVRNSSMRVCLKVAKANGIKLNIVEMDDGVEVINYVCSSNKKGITVDAVISDETMYYMGGTETWKILKRLMIENKIRPLDFYLVTAYSQGHFHMNENVYTKPLTYSVANEILSKLG